MNAIERLKKEARSVFPTVQRLDEEKQHALGYKAGIDAAIEILEANPPVMDSQFAEVRAHGPCVPHAQYHQRCGQLEEAIQFIEQLVAEWGSRQVGILGAQSWDGPVTVLDFARRIIERSKGAPEKQDLKRPCPRCGLYWLRDDFSLLRPDGQNVDRPCEGHGEKIQ